MILADNPIENKNQDKLRRSPLAERVAQMILKFKGQESFVIGVDGAWGSGKSSFVNMVLEDLGDQVISFVFNPWQFSNIDLLTHNFYNKFSEAVKPYSNDKNLGKKLKKYAQKLSVLDFPIPIYGIPVNPAWIGKLFEDHETLDDIRNQVNKALSLLSKKIIVVIDDIDRLDPEETKMIFKLVKTSANFPNTIFILSYDRVRVVQRLTDQNTGFDGNEYLKKIIQVNFVLPEPDQQDLWAILFNDLNLTLRDLYGSDDVDDKRWGELFHGGLSGLLKTIRDIKSFISSLRLNWSIIGIHDINAIDFIGIEAIRVFAPQFYNAMGSHKTLFTSTESLVIGSRDRGAERESEYKELIELIPPEIKKQIEGVCKELFPLLDFRTDYGHDWQDEWRKDLRVASREKFDFYFKLGVPTGSVSEVEVKNLMETLGDKKLFYNNLKEFYNEKRLTKVLSRVIDYAENLDEAKIENLVKTMWELQIEIKDLRGTVWEFDNIDTFSSRITYHSIKKNIDLGKRKNFLLKLINETTALSSGVWFVAIAIKEVEKKEKENRQEDTLIQVTDLSDLKKVIVDRIKDCVNKGTIKTDERLVMLLYRWKDFGDEAEVRKFIDNLVKDKAGFLTFLTAFVSPVYSSAGNYKTINKTDLEGLIKIETVNQKIAEFTEEEMKQLPPEQQEAIDLYKDPKGHW